MITMLWPCKEEDRTWYQEGHWRDLCDGSEHDGSAIYYNTSRLEERDDKKWKTDRFREESRNLKRYILIPKRNFARKRCSTRIEAYTKHESHILDSTLYCIKLKWGDVCAQSGLWRCDKTPKSLQSGARSAHCWVCRLVTVLQLFVVKV